ncbi:MAG: hypothetical protein ABFD08_06945 [Syntrophomonas sp.]
MDKEKNDWKNRDQGRGTKIDEEKAKEIQIYAGMEGKWNKDKGWVKGV